MVDMPATSPFSKSKLTPIAPGESYSEEGLITGLRTPNGDVLLNFDKNTKLSLLAEIARVLKAELITVKGTWTFTPHTEEDE